MPAIDLLGVKLIPLSQEELLKSVGDWISAREKAMVLSGNAHAFNLVYEHGWLREMFDHADAIRIDGFGVRLGARLLGYNTPPRSTWADFLDELAKLAEANGYSLFFLGSRPGVAETAANRLVSRYPQLKLVGTHHGYFHKESGSPENEAVLKLISIAQPDILIVGFGMPLQEHWILECYERIDACVILTGGAVFDYASGRLKRAPRWMRWIGLEWLGRLIIEPRRLWKRYLVGNPLFLWRVLRQRWKTRLQA